MSNVTFMPTQYFSTLTARHIALLVKKIDASPFGGHVTAAVDSNHNFLLHDKGPARLSDKGGVSITIWADREAKEGRAVTFIFDDCIGMNQFKAYRAFQDAVDPTLTTGAYQA